jgi:heme exporter protein C
MKKWLKENWYKVLAISLLLYVHFAGIMFEVPRKFILNETIRALYFHVPMWFGMMFLTTVSMVFAILYLSKPSIERDYKSAEFAHVGLIFGILGIVTGMLWAKYTWGVPWHNDPKQIYSAISLLIYLAYFVLRGSLQNEEQRARLSAVYNIFAFAAMVPLLMILPRMQSSMHPGADGNPGFSSYDLDDNMKMVFRPAVIGWILLGCWMASQRIKMRKIEQKILDLEHEKLH